MADLGSVVELVATTHTVQHHTDLSIAAVAAAAASTPTQIHVDFPVSSLQGKTLDNGFSCCVKSAKPANSLYPSLPTLFFSLSSITTRSFDFLSFSPSFSLPTSLGRGA